MIILWCPYSEFTAPFRSSCYCYFYYYLSTYSFLMLFLLIKYLHFIIFCCFPTLSSVFYFVTFGFVHRRCASPVYVTNDITAAGSRDLVSEPVDHGISARRRTAGQRHQRRSRRYCEFTAARVLSSFHVFVSRFRGFFPDFFML